MKAVGFGTRDQSLMYNVLIVGADETVDNVAKLVMTENEDLKAIDVHILTGVTDDFMRAIGEWVRQTLASTPPV